MRADDTRTYQGMPDGSVQIVAAGSAPIPLNSRLDLRNHSPTGFAWGYFGSGPAQLALALAADVLGDDHAALAIYQAFKERFVSMLPGGRGWGPFSASEIRQQIEASRGAEAAHPSRGSTCR